MMTIFHNHNKFLIMLIAPFAIFAGCLLIVRVDGGFWWFLSVVGVLIFIGIVLTEYLGAFYLYLTLLPFQYIDPD